jgi:hypothetical protein
VALEREAKSFEQGLKLLEEWKETREYIDALADKLETNKGIIVQLVDLVAKQGEEIARLAEERNTNRAFGAPG